MKYSDAMHDIAKWMVDAKLTRGQEVQLAMLVQNLARTIVRADRRRRAALTASGYWRDAGHGVEQWVVPR